MSTRLSSKLQLLSDNRIAFYCPGCGMTHQIAVGSGKPPRWDWDGAVENPTFSPSIKVEYDHWVPPSTLENPHPPNQVKVKDVCHSYIRNGQIQYLGDCTHHLKGVTIDLPEYWPKQDEA